ncbi:DNA repair protein XRCC2-like isoform X1 [Branchiostoma lanceolatum]|uniref:DNA repair protein XRCC2-like isoform X1 n=1 Tax=Branchiostoma lanceolatum TaxID=7740 RepID=UPI0034526352
MAASRESGAQLLARLGSRPSLIQLETSLFRADAGPKSGDAIEFYGPEGTAKTEMLLHLTARCILPTSQGGLEAGVVFVDTDYHFDILRLVTVLEGRLETTDEDRVKQCLRRLYIVRCNSSEQLVITLHSLEHIIASSSEVSLLIVDSISAFYWLDRSTDDSISGQELNQRRCVDILSRYLSDYGIVLIATKQALFGHKSRKSQKEDSTSLSPKVEKTKVENVEHYEYMSHAWQNLIKYRYVFSRAVKQDISTEQGGKEMTTFSATTIKPGGHKCEFTVTERGISFMGS